MKIAIILVLIIIFILCFALGISLEAKDYNKGTCKRCGNNLNRFDFDSHGGRGYRCCNVSCGYVTWVSYNCVDGWNN